MKLEKHHQYHIYNQGNNRRQIFYKEKNYHFFISKLKTHIVPYADILAWCLMPNHFHLMLYVKELELPIKDDIIKTRTINDSIGIILRTYTRAINLQEGFSGSLFRKATKAICLDDITTAPPTYYNTKVGTKMNVQILENNYPKTCFNYIHANPRKAGLVQNNEDWEYSSARAYYRNEKDCLVNRNRIMELRSSYY